MTTQCPEQQVGPISEKQHLALAENFERKSFTRRAQLTNGRKISSPTQKKNNLGTSFFMMTIFQTQGYGGDRET